MEKGCVRFLDFRKIFLLTNMFLSWMTALFIGRNAIKKYLVASVILTKLVEIQFSYARKKKWWWFYKTPTFDGMHPNHWGPYLMGSMWILKFTFGKFPLFLLVNAIVDFLYAFPGVWLFKKLKIAHLKRINRLQFFLFMMVNALNLYLVQFVVTKVSNCFSTKKPWKVSTLI